MIVSSEDLVVCPECDGTGQKVDPRAANCGIDPRDPAYPYEHEGCEVCDGTGTVDPAALRVTSADDKACGPFLFTREFGFFDGQPHGSISVLRGDQGAYATLEFDAHARHGADDLALVIRFLQIAEARIRREDTEDEGQTTLRVAA